MMYGIELVGVMMMIGMCVLRGVGGLLSFVLLRSG